MSVPHRGLPAPADLFVGRDDELAADAGLDNSDSQ